MQIKPQLDQLNVKLVAVGNGSKMFAQGFINSTPYTGELYLDPMSTAAKALQLKRYSAWEAITRFFNPTAASRYKQIKAKFTDANLKGDGQQSGGVFLVGPGTGSSIRFAHREDDYPPGEVCDLQEILRACGWTESMQRDAEARGQVLPKARIAEACEHCDVKEIPSNIAESTDAELEAAKADLEKAVEVSEKLSDQKVTNVAQPRNDCVTM